MTYHPSNDWLEQYAAGSLFAGQALCVAVHVSLCSECRQQVATLQSLGGVLLQQVGTADIADVLLDKVFAAIDAQPAAVVEATATAEVHSDIPRPLRRLIPRGYDAMAWSRVLPSMRLAQLDVGDQHCQVSLQRVRPGGKIALHDHRGTEVTLVLRGAFSDDDGAYRVGDFLVREPSQPHQPIATQNEECICLAALTAPVRFTGPLMRWVNPFLH